MKPEDFEKMISLKRDKLIKLGLEKGLMCNETIKCSQELDKLLLEYRYLFLEVQSG